MHSFGDFCYSWYSAQLLAGLRDGIMYDKSTRNEQEAQEVEEVLRGDTHVSPS